MPQQTPAQARVIDPILTTVVRGFKHPGLILTEALFPFVDVTEMGGTRIEFDKTDFREVDTRRAPGAKFAEVQFGHLGKTYGLQGHGLIAAVPIEIQREAATVNIDKLARGTASVMRMTLTNLEREQAALATDAANYAVADKVTLAGANQWIDPTSDIIGMVEDWKAAVRANIGQDPNTLVLPYGARKAIRKHNQLTEAIKYTQGGFPTMEQLSEFFEIERVFISKSITSADGSSLSDIWGDFGVLAYVEANPSTNEQPSYGYTYRMQGSPTAGAPYFRDENDTWASKVKFERSAEIVGADSGFLITDIIG